MRGDPTPEIPASWLLAIWVAAESILIWLYMEGVGDVLLIHLSSAFIVALVLFFGGMFTTTIIKAAIALKKAEKKNVPVCEHAEWPNRDKL